MGHKILATKGTADALSNNGITNVKILKKVHEEESGEDIMSYLTDQKIGFIINTPTSTSRKTLDDEYVIRKMASEFLIPMATRIETAKAIVDALERRGYHSIMRPIALNEVLESSPYGKYV
jgi:methylglyoxal synthase